MMSNYNCYQRYHIELCNEVCYLFAVVFGKMIYYDMMYHYISVIYFFDISRNLGTFELLI